MYTPTLDLYNDTGANCNDLIADYIKPRRYISGLKQRTFIQPAPIYRSQNSEQTFYGLYNYITMFKLYNICNKK